MIAINDEGIFKKIINAQNNGYGYGNAFSEINNGKIMIK